MFKPVFIPLLFLAILSSFVQPGELDEIYVPAMKHLHDQADTCGRTYDINIEALKLPELPHLPEKMVQQIEEQKSEFDRLFSKKGEKYKRYTPEFILDKIDNDADYHFLFVAEYWMAYHYREMIPLLVKRLTDKKEAGLTNSSDLIIYERLTSGDLQFYGHGVVAHDDLFTVAGRASHLLKNITGEDFGSVSMYATQCDLKRLQTRWANWLMNLDNE